MNLRRIATGNAIAMAAVAAAAGITSCAASTHATPAGCASIGSWSRVNITTLAADSGRLSTDLASGDMAAVETDGTKMAADARASEKNPPPVDTAEFLRAMTYQIAAGNAFAAGDIAATVKPLSDANAAVNRVTQAVKACPVSEQP